MIDSTLQGHMWLVGSFVGGLWSNWDGKDQFGEKSWIDARLDFEPKCDGTDHSASESEPCRGYLCCCVIDQMKKAFKGFQVKVIWWERSQWKWIGVLQRIYLCCYLVQLVDWNPERFWTQSEIFRDWEKKQGCRLRAVIHLPSPPSGQYHLSSYNLNKCIL